MKNIVLLSDGYKLSHHRMYPQGTTLVFSNFTPRSSKHAPKGSPKNGVIVSGIRKAIADLHSVFEEWFKAPFDESVKELLDNYLVMDYSIEHFRDLHKLGYLPVEIRAMKEGSFCPIGVPYLSIHNTHSEFYWITNFLETYLSANLWKSTTCATIASAFYKETERAFLKTTGSKDGMAFSVHNFSARGMDSVDAMVQADLGHLLYFNGSDTLPTMQSLKELYGVTNYMGNVPASEHSVMSAGTKENELETYSYLLDQFPKGFLSLVSDTWDLWNVLTNILPKLKTKIMSRDGKLVIRPDSGNPVDIICGRGLTKNERVEYGGKGVQPEHKGVVELLWEEFGGTINTQGYKVLDPHIGAIYGDSITVERQKEIYERLKTKGFAASNVVLGVGSYTYQYSTRDTFGHALKATYTERGGRGYNITKDPITDDGTKKSATGLLVVKQSTGGHGESIPYLIQKASWEDVRSEENLLEVVFKNGEATFKDSWESITNRAKENLKYLQF